MLAVLPYVADAFWILVMALIAGSSRTALARIPAAAAIPLPFAPTRAAPRAARNTAFAVAIGAPLLVGLGLLILGRQAETAEKSLLIFLLRTASAPLFALAHIAWLNGVLRSLDRDGAGMP